MYFKMIYFFKAQKYNNSSFHIQLSPGVFLQFPQLVFFLCAIGFRLRKLLYFCRRFYGERFLVDLEREAR